MLHPHISPAITKVSKNRNKKENSLQASETGTAIVDDGISVAGTIQAAKKHGKDIVTEIKQNLSVMEVAGD